MSILILTGPPAAGKNSVAPHIARQRARCAVIDVDQVRWMLLQPHVAPWDGDEGQHQCKLGVENACALATRFADDGCDVLILDFIWDYTLDIYVQQLAPYQPKIVRLMPSLTTTLARNNARGWLPAHEVEMLYAAQATLTTIDQTIDNSEMLVEQLAQTLLGYL